MKNEPKPQPQYPPDMDAPDLDPPVDDPPAQDPPAQDPPVQDPPANELSAKAQIIAKAKKYEINYKLIRAGKENESVTIKVSADTEEEAFFEAAKMLDAMNTEDSPLTWRYLGHFKVTPDEG